MTTATSSKKLTAQEIASAMSAAGWPASQIPTGVAVAFAESGGNPNATNRNSNGSTDHGLFQINSIHKTTLASGNWANPTDNARMALKVYKEAGNSWRPWVAYKSGSYRKFATAAAGVDTTGNSGDPAKDFVDGFGSTMGIVPTPAEMIIGNLGFIGSLAFWQRFGIGLLGVALIIVGVIIVFRKPATEVIKNIHPVGRAATIAKGALK